MQYSADVIDLPGSRQSIETVATKRNIYAMLTLSMLGATLFLAGLVECGHTSKAALNSLPDFAVLMCVGAVGFSLFFPFFLALYYSRHLLISMKRLEADNAELRRKIAAIAERVA